MLTSGQPTKGQTMIGHQGGAWSLAFSPDGETLASGGGDNRVALWHTEPAHPLARPLDGHSNGVIGLEFSPDGALLASGSQDDGLLIFWDPASGQPLLPPIEADQSGLNSVAFSPDGTMLATGGAEDALRLWHAEAGSENFGREAYRATCPGLPAG